MVITLVSGDEHHAKNGNVMQLPLVTEYWSIPRIGLAQTYLGQVKVDDGCALGLYAPPGSGMSAFLQKDFVPAAHYAGMGTAYFDMRDRVDAVDATLSGVVLQALSEEAVALGSPLARLHSERRGASDNAEHPVIFAMVKALTARPRNRAPIILIVDHCEQMCRTANAINEWDFFLKNIGWAHAHIRLVLSAATRSSFALMQQAARRADGSARSGIMVMQPRELPPPDPEFLPQCVSRYQMITQQRLSVAELERAYPLLGERPGHLVNALVDACASHADGIMQAVQAYAKRLDSDPYPQLALNALSVVELAVLRRALDGKDLFSKGGVQELRSIPGVSRLTNGALVQRAVNALMRLGILYPVGRAAYELESPVYERYLNGEHLPA